MPDKYGKRFETIFKKDFLKSFPQGTVDRIYDTMGMYKNVNNVCDFIGYTYPLSFYIENKTHKSASLPIKNITQYDKLVGKKDIYGCVAGVVLWLYEKDCVLFCPIEVVEQLKNSGEKSIGLRHKDKLIEVPTTFTKRKSRGEIIITPHSDYSILYKWWEENKKKDD